MDTTKVNPNRPTPARTAAIALIVCCSAVAQTATGSASGKLITESGQPLAGISATYRRAQKLVVGKNFHMAPAPGEQAFQGTLMTRADGAFNLTGLEAGGYSLCMDNPPPLYIDPCSWRLGGNTFTVVEGANTALKPITIVAGVRVHFLITDPQAVLPSTSRLEPLATIGVVTPNHLFRPATVSSRTGNVVDAVVTIPHNQPVHYWVFSKSLKFADGTGAPAKSSIVSPPSGATDYNVPLSVSR